MHAHRHAHRHAHAQRMHTLGPLTPSIKTVFTHHVLIRDANDFMRVLSMLIDLSTLEFNAVRVILAAFPVG